MAITVTWWTWREMSYSYITVLYKACSLILGAQSKLNLCLVSHFNFSSVKRRWNAPYSLVYTTWFGELWRIANFCSFNKSFSLWIINMLYNEALKLNEILAAQEVLVKWGNLLTTVAHHLEYLNKSITIVQGTDTVLLPYTTMQLNRHHMCFIAAVQLGFHSHMILSTCSIISVNWFIYSLVSWVHSLLHIVDGR